MMKNSLLCPVLWAAARKAFITAKSDGAFLYLNGLIFIAYQAPAFTPSSFLTCPLHPFWWINMLLLKFAICFSVLCLSTGYVLCLKHCFSLCGFPWTIFWSQGTLPPPLLLAKFPTSFKSHLFVYEVFSESLFQVKLSALFFFFYSCSIVVFMGIVVCIYVYP